IYMNSKQQSLDTIDMTSHVKKILLLACGSFNPPTPMHLRIFEIARDYFVENGSHQVIGGIISPANDAYKKPGLISSTHRCAMIKGVLQTSDWIRLSDWECKQEDFTRTRISLQYHQNYANSYINDINGTANEIVPNWLPHNIREMTGNIQVKLLCGADLLETFSVPGLWSQEDIEAILGQHGLVVISRSGSNPEKFIFESDLLTKYKSNITVVTNWVPNEVSSTLARRLISRQFSVKYLLDDFVIDYIKRFELYGSASKTKYILTPNQNELILSTTQYLNEKYQNQLNVTNYRYDDMDETDLKIETTSQSVDSIKSDRITERTKIFCCGSDTMSNVKTLLNRPGQAVQIVTDTSGTHDIEHEDEGLSLCFATLCVIDLFGVFPIIALPAALITCDAAVAELIYGKYMRIFVTILLDVTVFGGGVPNLLVAAQNLQLLGNRISSGNFSFSFCYWLILIGLFMCPIMWLGSPKNMKALASVSVFTCSAVALLIWSVMISDVTDSPFKGIEL
ncbi:Nicotinamide/nicotinic acid mononucleotide adenylyltransferase 1, partial [Pseudolycoriella hygida]